MSGRVPTVLGMSSGENPPVEKKLALRHLPRLAIEGALGNAAWALFVVAAVVIAALLKGEVAAWIFAVVLVVTLGISALIAAALGRQVERMRGSRDEARTQAADAIQRLVEVEEKGEAEQRELREQLAAASRGEQAVSTRMQSIARQVDALASSETAWATGPDSSQVALLVGLLNEFRGLLPNGDPILDQLLSTWDEPFREHNEAAWKSALNVLKARAVSLGAEEALGQPR